MAAFSHPVKVNRQLTVQLKEAVFNEFKAASFLFATVLLGQLYDSEKLNGFKIYTDKRSIRCSASFSFRPKTKQSFKIKRYLELMNILLLAL